MFSNADKLPRYPSDLVHVGRQIVNRNKTNERDLVHVPLISSRPTSSIFFSLNFPSFTRRRRAFFFHCSKSAAKFFHESINYLAIDNLMINFKFNRNYFISSKLDIIVAKFIGSRLSIRSE
uniref:Uncharacterized protein n=1 Tax=Glypta fumiferanae TaxID=389681 RepID=A0A0F6Q784_9HYME|nr:hypothetical protein [Glypta fumiferanae]